MSAEEIEVRSIESSRLDAPPDISFGWMMRNMGKIMGVALSPRKLLHYWNDDAWGPHVHLGILLVTVFLVAVLIWGIYGVF